MLAPSSRDDAIRSPLRRNSACVPLLTVVILVNACASATSNVLDAASTADSGATTSTVDAGATARANDDSGEPASAEGGDVSPPDATFAEAAVALLDASADSDGSAPERSDGAPSDAAARADDGGLPDLLVPSQGALLGAFVDVTTAGTVAQVEATLGRRLALLHHFFGWTDDFTVQASADSTGGRIPLITWEAWTNGVGALLGDIVGGAYDAMILSRAQSAKSIGKKFFLRWGHEMNGNWYPWSGASNGANATATATYVAAYRHVHDLFTMAGASNVLWVFCPNVDSVPSASWNDWANYYPGDAYVDWVGFDGYNWGTSQTTTTWQSFAAIANRIYPSLAAKMKPILIAETASAEVGGDKAAWIAGIIPSLRAMPAVKALSWFDMNKETDWRINSSPATQTSFTTMAGDFYFNR